ncbi:MAG: phytanoyl-CoA dioxygenase family protein [Gammaproteobacteria bacterium]|nr:phytanoyl-CoA dioxygenase family protein [Gammaproteobacteria bacterium]
MSSIRQDYDRDGYVVVSGLLTNREVAGLIAETLAISRGERGAIPGSLTAEEVQNNDDGEIFNRFIAIHFPHKISTLVLQALKHPGVVEILTGLLGPNVKAMQSMLFFKQAGKPGQAWHQDEFYIPTRDRSLTGVWIALDDATIENGCLWILPGSHTPGVIYPTRQHDDKRFDRAREAYDFPFGAEDALPVEVKKGDVVFFNGYLLHRSLPNNASSGYRRALVNHYMRAESLLPWNIGKPERGRTDYRDIVMVAGVDPYRYKGIKNCSLPYLRPDI